MNPTPQQGSGSAENTGGNRQDQENKLTQVSPQEQKDVEQQIGTAAGSVVGLHDLGQTSGRDDASGGSGDDMENTSTGEPTDR